MVSAPLLNPLADFFTKQPNFGGLYKSFYIMLVCTCFFLKKIHLIVIAGEVISTICWVSMDWMSLQKILGTNNFPTRTGESVDFIEHLSVAATG